MIVITRSISCFIQPATLNYFCFEITEDNFNRPWVKKHKSYEISIGKQFATNYTDTASHKRLSDA